MITVRVRVLLSCAVLSVGAVALVQYGFLLERGASLIVYPIIRLQHGVVRSLHQFFKNRKKVYQLEESVMRLREDKKRLLAETIKLNSLVWSLEMTQELVDFKKNYSLERAQLAQIIMKQCSDHEQSWLVDQGSRHGIEVDMVAVYQNCLLGRVVCVYPYYSKIVLITDAQCKVAVRCMTSQAYGIHEGMNSATTTCLKFVSHLHQLHENDLIISSGEGLVFPQGFGLGRIYTYKLDGLHYTIAVKPLVSFDALRYCYLIKKGDH